MIDPIQMYLPPDTESVDDPWVEREAYRHVWYAKGWRSDDDPGYTGTTDQPVGLSVAGDLIVGGSLVDPDPWAAAWRMRLAMARSGGQSAGILIVGDSIVEGYHASKFGNRWVDRLRRLLQGFRPGAAPYIPLAAGNGTNGTAAGDWAGGDVPFTFSGAPTRADTYGLGRRALSIPSGTSVTFTFFGDRVQALWVQTPTGPTAAAVTFDGVAQTAVDGRNDPAVAGQWGIWGTDGAYGFHTLVITPNDGPMVIEGMMAVDTDLVFLTMTGTVQIWDGSHSGYKTADHLASITQWAAASQNAISIYIGLIIVEVGVADYFGAVTAQQYEDNLVDIVEAIDAKLLASGNPPTRLPSVLFVGMPGLQGTGHAQAQRAAAARLGFGRAGFVDLAAMLPNREFGTSLSDDTLHPNDAGHIWLAERMIEVIDPAGVPQPTVPDTRRIVIDSSTPPTYRSAWAESWAAIAATALGRDASPTTGVAERRHRVWLEPGTYRATVTMQEDTGLGNVEVLVGRYVEAKASLVSCGTVTNAAGSPTLVTTRLATSVATEVAGWHPVVIRRTGTGAIRFVNLVLDKTA